MKNIEFIVKNFRQADVVAMLEESPTFRLIAAKYLLEVAHAASEDVQDRMSESARKYRQIKQECNQLCESNQKIEAIKALRRFVNDNPSVLVENGEKYESYMPSGGYTAISLTSAKALVERWHSEEVSKGWRI